MVKFKCKVPVIKSTMTYSHPNVYICYTGWTIWPHPFDIILLLATVMCFRVSTAPHVDQKQFLLQISLLRQLLTHSWMVGLYALASCLLCQQTLDNSSNPPLETVDVTPRKQTEMNHLIPSCDNWSRQLFPSPTQASSPGAFEPIRLDRLTMVLLDIHTTLNSVNFNA